MHDDPRNVPLVEAALSCPAAGMRGARFLDVGAGGGVWALAQNSRSQEREICGHELEGMCEGLYEYQLAQRRKEGEARFEEVQGAGGLTGSSEGGGWYRMRQEILPATRRRP